MLPEMVSLLKKKGLESWAYKGEKCQNEPADYLRICKCGPFRPKMRCNQPRLCRFCGGIKTIKIVRQFIEQFKKFPLWNERKTFGSSTCGLSMATFTQRNCLSYSHGVFLLKNTIKKWRHTKVGKKVMGGMYSVEVTSGKIKDSYNIHAHLLIYHTWIDNKKKSHKVKELGLNLSDLSYSLYIASGRHDYVVDIRPVTDRKKSLEYVLGYVFKSSQDLGLEFQLDSAISQFKKRGYNRFGSMYRLKIARYVKSCFKCMGIFIYISDFELESVGCFKSEFADNAEPISLNRCLSIYFEGV